MQKLRIARCKAERELEVASIKLGVWKESAVSKEPDLAQKQNGLIQYIPSCQHLLPRQHLPPSQHLPPIQFLLSSQHLPPLEFDPTLLMTSAYKAEQTRTIAKTLTAGESVSNICL